MVVMRVLQKYVSRKCRRRVVVFVHSVNKETERVYLSMKDKGWGCGECKNGERE
jgi:hypothetical protein